MTAIICPHPDCDATPLPVETQTCPICQTPLLLNGQYRLVRPLGEGGMGKTFLAQDLRFVDTSNEWCVLKQLKETQELAPHGKQLLKQEASRLLDLRHPGIPSYRDFFELTLGQQSRFCMVQQYIEGVSLREWHSRSGPISLQELLPIMKDVMEILEYLHHQKQPGATQLTPLLHLDIKPDNLMLRNIDNAVFLIDFGIAIQLDHEDIHTHGARASIHGFTRGFAPFEQTMGYAAPASDLYAWAMTCLVLLTGRSPHELLDPLKQKSLWPDLIQLPPTVATLFHHCLAFQVKDRLQDARDVLNILAQIELGQHPSSELHHKRLSQSIPSGDALSPIVETVSYDVNQSGETTSLPGHHVTTSPKQDIHDRPVTLSPSLSSQGPTGAEPSTSATSAASALAQPTFVSWILLTLCSLLVLGGVFFYHRITQLEQQGPANKRQVSVRSLVPRHQTRPPMRQDASSRVVRRMPKEGVHRPAPPVRRQWVSSVAGVSGVRPVSRPASRPTALHRSAPSGRLAVTQPSRSSISPEMRRFLREIGQPGMHFSPDSRRFFSALSPKRQDFVMTMVLRYGNPRARYRVLRLLVSRTTLPPGSYPLFRILLAIPARGMGQGEVRRKVLEVYNSHLQRGDIRAVDGLLAACRSALWSVRYFALGYLAVLDSKRSPRFDRQVYAKYEKVLLQLLDDPSPMLRSSAIRQWIARQYHPTSMIVALGRILRQDEKKSVRDNARSGLQRLSRTSSLAWLQMLGGLDTRRPYDRYWTTNYVARYIQRSWRFGLEAQTVKALTPILRDPQCKTVYYAVLALGHLGSFARHLLPTLRQIQRELDRRCAGAKRWERKSLKEALPLAIKRIAQPSVRKSPPQRR